MRHYEVVFSRQHRIRASRCPPSSATRAWNAAGGGQVIAWRTGDGQPPARQGAQKHYVLMNIETDQKTLDELTGAFRSATRCCVTWSSTALDSAVATFSPMAKAADEGARCPAGANAPAMMARAPMTTTTPAAERLKAPQGHTSWQCQRTGGGGGGGGSRFSRRKKFCRFTAGA